VPVEVPPDEVGFFHPGNAYIVLMVDSRRAAAERPFSRSGWLAHHSHIPRGFVQTQRKWDAISKTFTSQAIHSIHYWIGPDATPVCPAWLAAQSSQPVLQGTHHLPCYGCVLAAMHGRTSSRAARIGYLN